MIWTLFQIVEALFAVIGFLAVALLVMAEISRHESFMRRVRPIIENFTFPHRRDQ
jgi:hypothetical protein